MTNMRLYVSVIVIVKMTKARVKVMRMNIIILTMMMTMEVMNEKDVFVCLGLRRHYLLPRWAVFTRHCCLESESKLSSRS